MSTLHSILTAANDLLAHVPMVDVPNPDPQQPPGTGGITTIMAWLKWIGYAVVGGSIIVGGILIAVSFRRGEGHDALPKILWPMAGAIVIGAGAAWVGTIAGG